MSDATRVLEVVLRYKDDLTTGLSKSIRGLRDFNIQGGKFLGGIINSIFSLKTAIVGIGGYLVTRGLTGLVKSTADVGFELTKVQKITGMSVESLSELHYIADQAGTDFESLAKALRLAEKSIGTFRAGGGSGDSIFRLLGQDFMEAARSGEGMQTLFPKIIDGLEKIGDQEERALVASKLFGEGFAPALILAADGGEKIRQWAKDSHEMWNTWSTEDAASAKDFHETWVKMKAAISGVIDTGVKALLPTITSAMKELIDTIVMNRGSIMEFFASLLEGAAVVMPAIESAIKSLGNTLMGLSRQAAGVGDIIAGATGGEPVSSEARIGKRLQEIANLKQEFQRLKAPTGDLAGFAGMYGFTAGPTGEQIATYMTKVLRLSKEIRDIQAGTAPTSPSTIGSDLLAAAAGLRKNRGPGPTTQTVAAIMEQGKAKGQTWGELKEAYNLAHPLKEFKDVKDAIHGMARAWDDTYASMISGIQKIGDSLESSIVSGLEDAIDRGGKLREIIEGFLKDVRHELLRMGVKAGMSAIGSIIGLRAGGIADPGLPLAGRGLVTRGPVIAGEERPEAVVPLPDGRRIPVQLSGSAGTVINFYITATDAKSFNDRFLTHLAQNRDEIAKAAASGYQGRMSLRRKYA